MTKMLGRTDARLVTRLLDGLPPGMHEAARLARFIAGSQYAAVHLLDATFQHRVAAAGDLPTARTPIEESMCVHVVHEDCRVYTSDATADVRFANNPFVTCDDPVRFYLSAPLRTPTGAVLGTLCSFDGSVRDLDPTQLARFDDLAAQVSGQLEIARLAAELAHDVMHDALTGLPNRLLLADRLTLALARRRDGAIPPLVALIDLDGFKAVNDELGHLVGDAVLVELSHRLRAAVRDGDTVARLSGDEFVLILDGARTVDDLAEVGPRLRAVFDVPFLLGEAAIPVGGSIGMVLAEQGEAPYSVLSRADRAMYADKAKRAI